MENKNKHQPNRRLGFTLQSRKSVEESRFRSTAVGVSQAPRSPRKHRAVSADILWLSLKGVPLAAQHPTRHRTASYNKVLFDPKCQLRSGRENLMHSKPRTGASLWKFTYHEPTQGILGLRNLYSAKGHLDIYYNSAGHTN